MFTNVLDENLVQLVKERLSAIRPPAEIRSLPGPLQAAASTGLKNVSAEDRARHVRGLPGARFLFEALSDESYVLVGLGTLVF